jgi:hypothetical protein
MAPAMSRFSYKEDRLIVEMHNKRAKVEGVPITYLSTVRTKDKKSKGDDSDEEDDSNYITHKIALDPENKKSKEYSLRTKVFLDGPPESWVVYRETMDDLFKRMSIEDDPKKQHALYQASLGGRAKQMYIDHYNATMDLGKYKDVHDDDDLYMEALKIVLNETAKHFFPSWKDAVRKQKRYMRQAIRYCNQRPSKCIERFLEMNKGVKYYPVTDPIGKPAKPLAKDEILDIADQAVPIEWIRAMGSVGKKLELFENIEEATTYYDELYTAFKTEETYQQVESKAEKKRNSKRKNHDSATRVEFEPCRYCKRVNHHYKQCTDKNAKERYQRNARSDGSSSNKRYKKENGKHERSRDREKQVSNAMKVVFNEMYNDKKKEEARKRSKRQNEDAYVAQLRAELKNERANPSDEDESSISSYSSKISTNSH